MKKRIYLLFILLLSVVIIPIGVGAKTTNFYAEDNLNLKKAIDSTSFIAGNNVEVSSNIDGASFIAGENLKLSSAQDVMFAAGKSINLDNTVTKDAFIAGESININNSTIRDLYVVGTKIRIDSNIYRNAYIGGDTVTINSRIDGDVIVDADNIRIGKNATITGTLKYPEKSNISIAEAAQIGKAKTFKDTTITNKTSIMDEISSMLYAYIAMLVIGLILIALNKKVFTRIEKIKKNTKEVLRNFCLGLAFLILVPIVSFILLLTVIGLPLSIILLLIYGLLFYLSVIPTAYYLGNWTLKKKINNKYLMFTTSLLVIYILRLIPVIGDLVTIFSLGLGLGIYTLLIKENIALNKK